MSEYLIGYIKGNDPESPEAGAANRQKFMEWLDGLGDAVVNPGMPFGKSHLVSKEGVSVNTKTDRMIGFSIIKAENMDAALLIAKDCPYLEMSTIEVAEVMNM